ncbi:MAG: hypothetical protein CMO80_11440 [Verrucomicrobiales bacterium]|nr:hypothetical protein [Verrucomicrobiales bacterium]
MISNKPIAILLGFALLPFGGTGATVDFNRDIKPILSNNCFTCHGPDEEERKAKLRLDERGSAIADRDGYSAIIPGKPDLSELIKRIAASDDDVMPPPDKGQRLTREQVQLFKDWIAQGAKYDVHWSYARVKRPDVPVASRSKWISNDIDQFILRKLRANGLTPSPEADRWTLARRAAIDLTGLPPSVEELQRFIEDKNPKSFERYVDGLLDKTEFGEHWAGMWLDLARYADSAGYPSDPGRTIWSYRDWVISAFNDNMPFDQFTIEQIAGDMLSKPTDSQLIATAFHRNTMTQNEGGTSDEEFRNAAVVDRVNTTLAVWMGTSMACAQCHTHKYDPITQHEYFSFHAILNNSADADKRDESPLHRFYTDAQKKSRRGWQDEVAQIDKQFASPQTAWFRGLPAWEKQFAAGLKWHSPKPSLVRSQKKSKLEILDDNSVRNLTEAGPDAYTIQIPLKGDTLSAVRIQALADEKLPKKGPGLTAGNFVISKVTADLIYEGVPPLKGKIVRVELPGSKPFLHLAEVQVFSGTGNVAPKGKARQSSDYADAVAARAIDGNTNGDYFKKSVSHTAGKGPVDWWEVELKDAVPINKIVLWNRTDGNVASRLKSYTVKVLDAKRNTVWSKEEAKHPVKNKEFAIGGPMPIKFRSALADYTQPNFSPSAIIGDKLTKDKGWAVGGKIGENHHVTLIPSGRVGIQPGAKLRLIVRQNYKGNKHLLGRFRVSTTDDNRIEQWLKIPQSVLASLGTKKENRKDAQQAGINDYYVRNVAVQTRDLRNRFASLKKQIADQKMTSIPVMQELAADKGRTNRVQIRGSYQNLGDHVKPGVPAAFHPLPKSAQADRLAMAKWLVSKDNPLTARVTVNRFWERLFGTGLVRTSEEFGAQGELPTHPELLDWLAAEFVEGGWNVKELLKKLVASSSYRQSSKVTPKLLQADPMNRLISRGPRFRATGEVLRDQALYVSGLLSAKMYGEPVRPVRPNLGLSTAFGRSNDWTPSKGEDAHRRSIYTLVRRNSPYPSFSIFDAPNREACTIRRSRSNTPLQAFVTMNDPAYVEAAQSLARRVVEKGGGSDAERFGYLFLTCTSRKPKSFESKRLQELLNEAREVYGADAELAKSMATDPLGMPGGNANLAELAAWTTVANVILNLDEMIMRR